MDLFIHIYVGLICFLLGSFYNVVAIRLLKKESIAFPQSHCPTCKHNLGVLDLVPVFSYLWLRGKCRYCQDKISPLYPIGEAVSGGILYALYWKVGLTPELLPAFLFGTALLLATWTDIRERLILDKITFPLMFAIGISRFFIREHEYWYYLLGAGLIFIVLWMVAFLSKGGFGGGDVKLFALVGLTLGIQEVFLSLFFASLVAVIASIPIASKKGRKTEIAFAPYILIGSLIVYFFSPYLPLI